MFRFFLILFFIIPLSNVWAQSKYQPLKDTLSFKKKVDKMSLETQSIESEFIQVKKLAMLSEDITSKGNFVFAKPNNLRWQYHAPFNYVIVINKEKILIKDENNKVKRYDMNSNKVFKEINDVMISCVNGDILHSGKFKIYYFENDKGYKLELEPVSKTMKESLKKINMYFDKNVTSVLKLEMFENGEDMTSISFTNKKINAAISPQTFILK